MAEAASKKLQRDILYKEREVQMFLEKIITEKIGQIDPVFDVENGCGYRYPDVEAIVNNSFNTGRFLGRLYEAGILERKLYDRIFFCPHCNSPKVSFRYCCPYCGSLDIKKSTLIEHIPCGYISDIESFQADDRLVCPRCQRPLKKTNRDYLKAGVWCTCNVCGKNFDIARPLHFCHQCRREFGFEESLIENVYSYSLNAFVIQEVLGWTIIPAIENFLLKNGFTVKSPGSVKGKSGARHPFNLLASNDRTRKLVVIDVATSNEEFVPEDSVISMFIKVYDSSVDEAVLIVIPKSNKRGKKLAAHYKIKLIEVEKQEDVPRTFGNLVKHSLKIMFTLR